MRTSVMAGRSVLIAIFVICWSVVGCDSSDLIEDTSFDDAANVGLDSMRNVVKTVGYADFGFPSTLEVDAATLMGPPIPVFYVRLDLLKAYAAGDTLLGDTIQFFYPIGNGTDVRTAMIIARRTLVSGYTVVGYGGSHLVQDMVATRTAFLAANPQVSAASLFAVRIPAFNLDFIGGYVQRRLLLQPLRAAQSMLFSPDTLYSDTAVFSNLVTPANTHNGQPR